MEIPQPLPWDERKNGVGPMPGGYTGYLVSLRAICERLEEENLSFETLVTWTREKFNISETSSRLRLAFLRNAGLIHPSDGVIAVDSRLRHWIQNGGDDIPVAIIHSRIKFIGEMLSELKEPKSAEELRKAASRYDLDWQTYTQIRLRSGWLQSAQLIERTQNRLRLTGDGRRLLSRLNIHTPNQSNRRKRRNQPKPDTRISLETNDADRLAEKIKSASTDSADPGRFERLVRDAFVQLGFIAKHLGAPGSTDVLLTAPLGKDDSYSVAVDAKTTASGSLNDNQVDWQTLKEHRAKHDADYSLLVAPDPGGARLMNRARTFRVAVLSADQLADLCRRHARTPLGLVEYKKLVAMQGEVDLGAIDEATEHLVSLQRLASLLSRELIEKTDRFGRMSARDVHMAFGEEAKGVSQDDIQRLLEMLAHPLIGVIYGFTDNGPGEPITDFVLATSRDSGAQNIRQLADSVASAES